MTKREWALFAVLQALGIYCLATANVHDYPYRMMYGALLMMPGTVVAATLLNLKIYSTIAYSLVAVVSNALFWHLLVTLVRRAMARQVSTEPPVAKS